ncbi:ABC transporter permease [Bifidobacterium sp. ESL0769]|uniref:ABC transporter permease n=1 Tax=Bifidobacterium sp. ESL0769 TaxID=2983229 RepID=UPI0023F6D206|nr:ABC transporter permease [Bifidobacterium sp. ESL0769]WEV68224.1 ABC transporter permease [Bifidobacterium sp. ESL0769]
MNICKAALTVAKRHRTYILFYLVALSLVMTAILFQSVSDTHGSASTYSPDQSRVAVVDRDGGDGGIATGLKDYLGQTNTVVHVDDNRRAMQDAMATDAADAIYVVPKGYMRDFADAVSAGQTPKQLSVVITQGEPQDLSETKVSTFLSNLRTAYLAGTAAKAGNSHVAATETNGMGVTGAKFLPASRPANFSSIETYPTALTATKASTGASQRDESAIMHSAVREVVRAGNSAKSDAHVSVVSTHYASGNASATLVFGRSLSLGSYPIVTSMIVVIAMVIGAFTVESTRRRMEVSPASSRAVGPGLLAACAGIGVLVTIYYLLLSLGVTAIMAGSLAGLTLRPVLLATCSMAIYVFFGISIGFVLGRLAVSTTAANGLANVLGLAIGFTSGAWSFGSSVMTGPVALIGKLLCGRWYLDAIDRAMGLGIYAGGTSSLAGWASSTGMVALFAVALVCVGLAVGSPKRHKERNRS